MADNVIPLRVVPSSGAASHDTTPSASAASTEDQQDNQDNQDQQARQERQALRENARRVLRESGVADILQRLNKQALQGRGWFEEYDSGVVFKWGGAFTRRHIWVDVAGDTLRFRLKPHRRCAAAIPACDGEYHTFTPQTWSIPGAVLHEVDNNYKKPVAETSED